MGLLANSLRAFIPERKQAIAAAVPTWDQGREQNPPTSYDRNSRDGYMLDELVYACIDFRATSAGEPPLCVYKPGDDEKIDHDHPALDLLNRPNPHTGRSRFWAGVLMCMDIGGNAYVEKVRSAAGRVVELWLLRPDRVTVIPSEQEFISGYRYRIGDRFWTLPAQDVIHFKTRHPLDDYYGMAPLVPLANRVDLDVWQRRFTEAFFRNAGVPSGLLNIVRQMNQVEREQVRNNYREMYGGSQGWHRLLVLDGGQAEYTPMGLPMGSSGLAMPELNLINESRICMAFGVPPALIGTMVGMQANRGKSAEVSERELFWESTMVPAFRDLDSTLTLGLLEEFPDLDRIEHDLSTIKALQDDVDKRHERFREDYQKGLLTWQEARAAIGIDAEPDEPGMVLVSSTMVPTWSDELLTEPEPIEPATEPAPLPPSTQAPVQAQQPVTNGRANGAAH